MMVPKWAKAEAEYIADLVANGAMDKKEAAHRTKQLGWVISDMQQEAV